MNTPWYPGWMSAPPSYATPYAAPTYWTLPDPRRGPHYTPDPSTLPRPGGKRLSEFAVSEVQQQYEMEVRGPRGKRERAAAGYFNEGFDEDNSKV